MGMTVALDLAPPPPPLSRNVGANFHVTQGAPHQVPRHSWGPTSAPVSAWPIPHGLTFTEQGKRAKIYKKTYLKDCYLNLSSFKFTLVRHGSRRINLELRDTNYRSRPHNFKSFCTTVEFSSALKSKKHQISSREKLYFLVFCNRLQCIFQLWKRLCQQWLRVR